MSERKVLFIVEGERGEPRLLRRMHDVLLGTTPGSIHWHGTVVYDLLRRVFEDGDADDLDVVSVLRESVTDPERREVLEQEFRESGKLYINYPCWNPAVISGSLTVPFSKRRGLSNIIGCEQIT